MCVNAQTGFFASVICSSRIVQFALLVLSSCDNRHSQITPFAARMRRVCVGSTAVERTGRDIDSQRDVSILGRIMSLHPSGFGSRLK